MAFCALNRGDLCVELGFRKHAITTIKVVLRCVEGDVFWMFDFEVVGKLAKRELSRNAFFWRWQGKQRAAAQDLHAFEVLWTIWSRTEYEKSILPNHKCR